MKNTPEDKSAQWNGNPRILFEQYEKGDSVTMHGQQIPKSCRVVALIGVGGKRRGDGSVGVFLPGRGDGGCSARRAGDVTT